MIETLFFIHIPKTAGTSLRHALEREFPNSLLKDYGKNSETSCALHNIRNDGFSFENYLKTNHIKVFTGHTKLKNNRFHFRSQNIFCFIRNPIDQVLSHYNHHSYHNSYSKSLEDFVTDERYQNVQSRYLAGLPIRQIGFIGITEQYASSLAMINKMYSLNLAELSSNKSIINKPKPTSEVYELIKANNKTDFELYEEALYIFEERKGLFMNTQPWTYGDSYIEKLRIHGWAYTFESNEAVSLGIYIDDELIQELTADQLLLNMRAFGTPRNGYVGYACKLPKAAMTRKSTIKVVNSTTNQVINTHYLG
jgi:hypothetical protein